MNFLELQDEVLIKLQDNSSEIIAGIPIWINEVVNDAIEQAEVPGFKSFGSVDTVLAQAYTSLPVTCSPGRVLYVGDGSGEITRYATLDTLIRDYPDLTTAGSIEAVTVEGSLLYYQGIPDPVETLVLLFKRVAIDMVDNTDVPDTIPSYLHRNVIVSGAAVKGFDLIEEGLEEDKINLRTQKIAYNEGIKLLSHWSAKRRNHLSSSIWRY